MKIPLSWLKEYVQVDATPQEIADRLTFSGTEVGGIEKVGGDFDRVVVGEISAIERHPKADKLHICIVNDGARSVRVVCGANNYVVGDKVPLACVGAKLANGMTIAQVKLRGELSDGMLCAEDELGLSNDHSGIMLLPRDIPAGTPFSKVAGPPDSVFHMEVTWNRPDCLCVIGIAREVAALFGQKLRLPDTSFVERSEDIEKNFKVTIDDPAGCPRYTGRLMKDVRLGPSPEWIQRRLKLCGVRPISNVVDITNYVMLECGQPLHAFDYTLLENREIVVRRVRLGEKMATLDGIDRNITSEMLVIADGKRPVALAGIMGGAGSEINDRTSTVLLESAYFNPPLIRKTSSKLGLTTESSYRFERNVDIGSVEWASRRATALMAQHAGASVYRGVVDVFPGKPAAREVKCRYQRIRELIGVELADAEVDRILGALELPIAQKDNTSCTVNVPSFRPDIEIEADLIEEVARVHGLDKVPSALPRASIVSDMNDQWMQEISACRSRLLALGLTEIMNYSFGSKKLFDLFNCSGDAGRVTIPNPVSADYAVMRDSLLPQMVESLGRNLSRQVEKACFFEIGKTFLQRSKERISEESRLSIGLMGGVGWSAMGARNPVGAEEMFMWMKGLTEALFKAQHIEDIVVKPESHPVLDSRYSVAVEVRGERLGVYGLVKSSIRSEWRMIEPVAVGEFALAGLTGHAFVVPALRAIPAYPAVKRDVAIIVAESVRHEDVLKIIHENAPPELTAVNLFDIFKGEVIGEGKKSLAYTLVYRSHERTLTDEEANRFHESLKAVLKSELSAEIRER